MPLKSRISGHTGIIELDRDLDASTIALFRKDCRDLADRGAEYFVIDFGRTEFVDSSGVGAIILLAGTRRRRSQVILVNCRESLRKVLFSAGLERVVTVCATLDEAMRLAGSE